MLITLQYLSNFIIQRWLDARELIGLNNNMFKSNDDYQYISLVNNVSYVYTKHSGVIVTHNQNGLVPYARIYKCGNEAIGKHNLIIIIIIIKIIIIKIIIFYRI